MLIFNKVNSNKYVVNIDSSVMSKVNDILDDISLGNRKAYEDNINIQLFDSILSRYVSSMFFESKNNVSELNFATIEANLGDRTIIISLGIAEFGSVGKKRLNGVLYR